MLSLILSGPPNRHFGVNRALAITLALGRTPAVLHTEPLKVRNQTSSLTINVQSRRREQCPLDVDTGHCGPSWALSALRPRRTLGTCQLILDPSVSLFLGRRSRAARPKASGSSHALPTWVSRPKRGLGQNCETGGPSPVPLPVPADNYPCSRANAPCSDLKGIVAPARPLIHARDAWRQDFDMIAAGDPPLSGPDSRVARRPAGALPPAYPITTAGAPTRMRP